METESEDPAVTRFREYLRIKTVHPDPDYDSAITFLKKQADELSLPYQVLQLAPGNPIIIMTWTGTHPALPAILLNSHLDVVPVFPEHWKVDPFSATKMDNGDIYARGSQDMKCVGMQYLEAIRRLQKEGKTCPRTIHISFVPDEEVGGYKGMARLVKEESFHKLNIAFTLDEGLANPTDAFTIFYGERTAWWYKITCPGNPGHGSRFVPNNAGVKVANVIKRFMEFRAQEEERLNSDKSLKLGDVTTVNLTMMRGGVQTNVVPSELTVNFDCRVNPQRSIQEFTAMVDQWLQESGDGITYELLQYHYNQTMAPTDESDHWWNALGGTLQRMGLTVEPEIFPAATDSRYIRDLGIRAYGFSPMNNTPILLHDHNECLNEKTFLRGIDIYCNVIPALASVPV